MLSLAMRSAMARDFTACTRSLSKLCSCSLSRLARWPTRGRSSPGNLPIAPSTAERRPFLPSQLTLRSSSWAALEAAWISAAATCSRASSWSVSCCRETVALTTVSGLGARDRLYESAPCAGHGTSKDPD